jgi:hypothetical protein
MLATGDDFRAVFWWAVIPAVLSVALLAFGIRDARRRRGRYARIPLRATVCVT